MDDQDYEITEPRAAAIVESLRAIGYSLPTAIADLVDNSITAGARNVWLGFHWDGADSTVSILDDGNGMSAGELTEAMRPGSLNPLDERAAHDLGRFGLGLKTASFSQCRRLTVASRRQADEVSVRRWDLDYVVKHDAWRLLKSPAAGSECLISAVGSMDHGTLVLWECLDRVTGGTAVDSQLVQDHFLRSIEEVKWHLEMVFHRFLAGKDPALAIFLNGRDATARLAPWDPFIENHSATYSTPIEEISCGQGVVRLEGFVLPHKDLLGEQGHRLASGPAGWNAQQGFYVYRNRRMVVAGSWLGLGADRPWTKEEHYKLARIRIDIPNTMDLEWRLDVKKSTASPPSALRPRLKALAGDIRKQAREVFAHRGGGRTRGASQPIQRVWRSTTKDGRLTYHIDRAYPLVKQVLDESGDLKPVLQALLRVLEETVPVAQIWLDAAEKPDDTTSPFAHASERELRTIMESILKGFLAQGLSREAAGERLSVLEPFNAHPEIVATLLDLEA